MRREDVSFVSDGLRLAGVLRRPEISGTAPGVVLTGPFTGVKEQVVGTYAERLTDRGFATLAFDHRGFGSSEGLPRQHEDSAGKLQDLLDATSFLAAAEGRMRASIATELRRPLCPHHATRPTSPTKNGPSSNRC